MTAPTPDADGADSNDTTPAERDERALLAEAMERLGPDAPTILPGWNALELLDHLLQRERRGHLMLGGMLPGQVGRRAREAEDAAADLSFGEKVAQLREGPPRISPTGHVDALTGQAELLIHLEDLLRAQPRWSVPDLPEEATRRAWRAAGLFARMMRVRTEVLLISPLGGRRVRRPRAEGTVRVLGEPLELLLWASGRDEVAQVRLEGDGRALAALAAGSRSI